VTAAIEDVSRLPGKTIRDQNETPIGKVADIYAIDGDGEPMWVTVEARFDAEKRTVFVPLARIKVERDELEVPYTKEHVGRAPEVDGSEGISPECERELRDHYGIDTGDQELRSDNKSYATLVPEGEGIAKRVQEPDELERVNPDKRTEKTRERLGDPGDSEARHFNAKDLGGES
jgi:hypothetical protein